jgi:4-oxalocrotonate tautomerase
MPGRIKGKMKGANNASRHREALARKIRTAEAATTEAIVKDVMNFLNYGEESVSVAIEEVKQRDWPEKVYRPDIVENSEQLYKKPGYTM